MIQEELVTGNDKKELGDFAYRSLIHMMMDNRLKPGETILETELAKILEMSRTPVRQALGRLIGEGLLEKKRKKGYIIPHPNSDDARQVFHIRQYLECEMVRLACLNANDHDIKKLNQILKNEREALSLNNKERYWLANETYHFGLMKAARNIYLERYCRHIFRRSSIYIFFFDSFYSQEHQQIPPNQLSPAQHVKILEAIENRDCRTAENEMKKHIQLSFKVLLGL